MLVLRLAFIFTILPSEIFTPPRRTAVALEELHKGCQSLWFTVIKYRGKRGTITSLILKEAISFPFWSLCSFLMLSEKAESLVPGERSSFTATQTSAAACRRRASGHLSPLHAVRVGLGCGPATHCSIFNYQLGPTAQTGPLFLN